MIRTERRLGSRSGILIANPIPEEDALPAAEIEARIAAAREGRGAAGIAQKEVTPYLLARINELTGGKSLDREHRADQEQRRAGGRDRGRAGARCRPAPDQPAHADRPRHRRRDDRHRRAARGTGRRRRGPPRDDPHAARRLGREPGLLARARRACDVRFVARVGQERPCAADSAPRRLWRRRAARRRRDAADRHAGHAAVARRRAELSDRPRRQPEALPRRSAATRCSTASISCMSPAMRSSRQGRARRCSNCIARGGAAQHSLRRRPRLLFVSAGGRAGDLPRLDERGAAPLPERRTRRRCWPATDDAATRSSTCSPQHYPLVVSQARHGRRHRRRCAQRRRWSVPGADSRCRRHLGRAATRSSAASRRLSARRGDSRLPSPRRRRSARAPSSAARRATAASAAA